MKRYEPKMHGKSNVQYIQSENRYKLSFECEIVNLPNDSSYQTKLSCLGFKIISANRYFMKVELPERWSQIKTGHNTSVIVDYCGRIRMEMDDKKLTCALLTKFGYGIEVLKKGDMVETVVYFTDNGIRYPDHQTFNVGDFYKESMGTVEQAIDIMIAGISKDAESLLDGRLELWRNELAYWEDWAIEEG
jgi:hypothetical protein